MAEQGSSSSSITITPELLEAMTKQFLELQQKHSPRVSSTTHKFGSITLHELQPQQAFKAKEAVGPRQQILLDYLWNAKTRPQMLVAIHALAYYFNEANNTKALSPNIKTGRALELEVPPRRLLSTIKELEVENSHLHHEVIRLRQIEKDYELIKSYVLEQEKKDIEIWGSWKNFPQKLQPIQDEVLDRVCSDSIGEQMYLQQYFRRLACQPPQYKGLSFAMESYSDDKCKGFSFLTCNIDLSLWNEAHMMREHCSLHTLMKQCMIRRLTITAKSQLALLSNYEKLYLVLTSIYEHDHGKGTYEAEFQCIPPSFYPGHLDDARSQITIHMVACAHITYVIIPQDSMVPEELVDMLDQINQYKAMAYRRSYTIQPKMQLMAEDRAMKIYAHKYYENKFIRNNFTAQSTGFAQEVMYFNKIRAHQLTRLEGDIFFTPSLMHDVEDEETLQNLDNMLEM